MFSNEGLVSFVNAQFSQEGDVNFSGAEFTGKGNVSFDNAKFSGEGDVNFSEAKFTGEGDIDFSNAEFYKNGSVTFYNAEFKNGSVTFYNAEFSGKGDVSFHHTQFVGKGDLDFQNTRFSGKGIVNFNDTEFSNGGSVDFYGAKFSGITYFIKCAFSKNVYFKYVRFLSPEEVSFDTEDLSNVSFLNTDIARLNFAENTRFGKLKPENNRFKISDERTFEKCINKDEAKTSSNLQSQGLSFGGILASYRNLRENYERRYRYTEAGQFFIREMELKRKYRNKFSANIRESIPKHNSWIRRNFSFIGLYNRLCKYGENSILPIIIFGVLLFLSTTYWHISATTSVDVFKNCNEPLIFCSFERTLQDIVAFPQNGVIIDYVTRIASIIVLAILFIPLRRQFERRFRHQ